MYEQVLDSWIFLEMIEPAELPKYENLSNKNFKDNKKRPKLREILKAKDIIPKIELENSKQKTIQYKCYINIYQLGDLVELFREHFNNTEEIINRSAKKCYGISILVDEKGKYIEESLFVPHLHLLVHQIQNKKDIDYINFIEDYQEGIEYLENKAIEHLSDGISYDSLLKFQKSSYRYFSQPTKISGIGYVETIILDKDKEIDMDFNSFYLGDLQKIKKDKPNQTLKDFIKGKRLEIDIDENRDEIENILEPKNLPIGRWPSQIDHRLALMQQVAVNSIINGNERIYSVNGPPGTGKTTLLQDIFANIIVERAINMSSYSNPKDAFKHIGTFEGKFKCGMYALNDDIANHAMVVASSNNGAVENISKELPELDKIIREIDEDRDQSDANKNAEELFSQEAKELNLFSEISSKLLKDQESWGLFSVALGRRENINVLTNLIGRASSKDDEPATLMELLSEPLTKGSWKDAVKDFNQQLKVVEELRDDLQEFKEKYERKAKNILSKKELGQKLDNLNYEEEQIDNSYQKLQELSDSLNKQLSKLNPGSFINRIKMIFIKDYRQKIKDLQKQINEVDKDISTNLSRRQENIRKMDKLNQLKIDVRKLEKMKEEFKDESLIIPDNLYWSEEEYESRQVKPPWQIDSLNEARSILFLKALKVQKIFIMKNDKAVRNAIHLLGMLDFIDTNNANHIEYLEHMWKILHLVFPVQSTTFASFSSMYKGIGKDYIDYLFIDEAGQASPQQAAGALWRSKKAIVVGDPIQIEPVVTTDKTILEDVKKKYSVTDHHIGPSASVQVLADYANIYGTYKGEEGSGERIGIPLWVHRRCLDPMFSISNEIAYDNKMVLAIEESGQSKWFDISGKAIERQYVKEQGKFMLEEIDKHFSQAKDGEEPNVFVITPFTAVRSRLINLVINKMKDKYPDIKDWAVKSIGTVHTFQGKEADIVYFVAGTDNDTDSAANWSCSKPNLLNVAVTRAKKEFYIVGDKERLKDKQFYNTIYKYSTGKSS